MAVIPEKNSILAHAFGVSVSFCARATQPSLGFISVAPTHSAYTATVHTKKVVRRLEKALIFFGWTLPKKKKLVTAQNCISFERLKFRQLRDKEAVCPHSETFTLSSTAHREPLKLSGYEL